MHAVEVLDTVHSVNVPRSVAGLLVVTQLVVYQSLKSYQSGWLMLHLEYASQQREDLKPVPLMATMHQHFVIA